MKASKSNQFDPLIEKLHKIVATIEDDQGGIEASLKAYEEGINLVHQAQKYLADAEQRVRILSEDSPEAGNEAE